MFTFLTLIPVMCGLFHISSFQPCNNKNYLTFILYLRLSEFCLHRQLLHVSEGDDMFCKHDVRNTTHSDILYCSDIQNLPKASRLLNGPVLNQIHRQFYLGSMNPLWKCEKAQVLEMFERLTFNLSTHTSTFSTIGNKSKSSNYKMNHFEWWHRNPKFRMLHSKNILI